MIRRKHVSSVEVAEAYMARITAINPRLNAVVTQRSQEQVLAEAAKADELVMSGDRLKPLHGVPFSVKDVFVVSGVPCTAGTLGLENFVGSEEGPQVARLKRAGAIPIAMTNCSELGFAFESDNLLHGRTNNPYDLTRTPGGSSGGEAALIAAGGSPIGLGGDGGGSLRLPAHFCGITTIKPTWGLIPCLSGGVDGVERPNPGAYSVQAGPLARRVEDLALLLPILAGPTPTDPSAVEATVRDMKEVELDRLRVAFHTDNGIVTPTKEIRDAVTKAAMALAGVTGRVEEKRPPRISEAYDLLGSLIAPGAEAQMRARLEQYGTKEASPLYEEGIRMLKAYEADRKAAGWSIDATETQFQLRTFNQSMTSFMTDYDVMLCPVNAQPAMKHGTTWSNLKAFSYGWTFNLTGQPAAVVRCGTSPEGLPIGVQIVGHPFREDVVLAVADYLESQFGGWQPPPEDQLLADP
jgi:amidase